jgi:hypothetical protein
MKQIAKQQRQSFELLCQKAGIINREMDAKCDKMEELAADVKADARECSEWATRCAGHATGAAEANNDACLWSESAHKAARFSLLCACVALLEFLGMVLIVIFFV